MPVGWVRRCIAAMRAFASSNFHMAFVQFILRNYACKMLIYIEKYLVIYKT